MNSLYVYAQLPYLQFILRSAQFQRKVIHNIFAFSVRFGVII